ncbi:hypothetical protein GCM10025864_20340 [Luteimicrobium album]|uniref:Uncharacterized protein n=1 Tax=Luteimicrobium album TaxID=1054550 RepID=A0ABQ6I0V6_9MICO|nr:hypothetical protein [Luteimicrobium album]GMA24275.1 hypothetical protein GCM10025864_20340 [Luteimicrobium album]
MTHVRRPGARLAGAVVGTLATALLAGAGLVAAAVPASAEPRVTVSGPDGAAHADLTYSTTLTLAGSGFQSIKGGFGGIYVLFGWVDDPQGGSWRPSQGGKTGTDLRYVPDSETKDNKGFEKFVSFPGSDTEYAANGGEIKADGTWKTTLVVPGPTFQTQDRDGTTVTVDCRKVTCGVITIGAHGVVNPSNETFTAVSFVDLQGARSATKKSASGSGAAQGSASGSAANGAGSSGAGSAGSGTAGSSGAGSAGTDTAADGAASTSAGTGTTAKNAEAPASATLGVDKTTAVAGHVLSFVAQGFTPGEQVVGSFDDGVLAVGPLTAGAQGDVAGVLQLPDDTRLGTHTLKLTGAKSGQAPEVALTVRRDPAEASAADAAARAAAAASAKDDGWSPAEIAVGVAALLLLAVILSSFVTARRRKRAARAQAPTEPGLPSEPGTPAAPETERTPGEPVEPSAPQAAPEPPDAAAAQAEALFPILAKPPTGPSTQPVPTGRHA